MRERVAARAGVQLSPGATWALIRIDEHGLPGARALAEREGVAAQQVTAVTQELSERGLLERDGVAQLTEAGREHTQRLVSARCELLAEALADDSADRDPQVSQLL